MKELIRCLLPRSLKSHRIRRGPLAGCFIHTSWHDYPGAIRGTTEAPLLRWFQRNVAAADTWLDIGAHYGYTAIALSRLVGPGGRVVAFEPVLRTARCAAHTREINNLSQLQIVPTGLSRHSGTQIVTITRGMAAGALAFQRGEPIPTTAFDTLWPTLHRGNPRVDGIKIDVQGAEAGVLEGMSRTLHQWHPRLVIEFHKGVARAPILDFLESHGYNRRPEPINSPSATSPDLEDDKSYAFHPESSIADHQIC